MRSWPTQFGNDFGLVQKGLLMLCKTEHALHEEAQLAAEGPRAGPAGRGADAGRGGRARPGRPHGHRRRRLLPAGLPSVAAERSSRG